MATSLIEASRHGECDRLHQEWLRTLPREGAFLVSAPTSEGATETDADGRVLIRIFGYPPEFLEHLRTRRFPFREC